MSTNKNTLVKREYIVPFVLVTTLFFMWGFARALLDVLNKHFQDVMDLSKSDSSWIQVMTYTAYFLMAIPAGLFINKFGYRKGVILGLSLFALGALFFIPSEYLMSYGAFLGSLFVLGSGLVFLETAANPYVTYLGAPATAASRLNLAQSFNGLGCVLAPMIGAAFMFTDDGGSVAIPYGVMGATVLLVALLFTRVNLPEITPESDELPKDASVKTLLKHNRFMLGLFALFCYEIAEISINTFFINFASDDGWLTTKEAAAVLSFCGLGLFLMGRVIGSIVMSRIRAEVVLTVCAVMTVVGALVVMSGMGVASKYGVFLCYAFESIMFPTIFALALTGLGPLSKRAASYLMMTPIGGAVGSFLMGAVADYSSMSISFIVPLFGYAVVLYYSYQVLMGKLR